MGGNLAFDCTEGSLIHTGTLRHAACEDGSKVEGGRRCLGQTKRGKEEHMRGSENYIFSKKREKKNATQG